MNIAILTNFTEFNPGYSLTGIVIDQAEMLARFNHKVVIYVNENFNAKHNKESGLDRVLSSYPHNVFVLAKTKLIHLTDYTSRLMLSEEHKRQSLEAAEIFTSEFIANDIQVVLTHDFIFTGWNLPYADALVEVQNRLREDRGNIRYFHWVHSIPSGSRDWWDLARYQGQNYIVYPNRVDINRVAESFRTTTSRVRAIPHIKDIRAWFDFGSNTLELLNAYPNIMQSSVVQVYPCSSDRLYAKKLQVVIKLFAFMKRANCKVFLVIANQWATGKQPREAIAKYKELAEHYDLVYGEDYIFTSEHEVNNTKPYENGISKAMLRELQLISSIFIFPTREETFGLVGPESSYSGAFVVSNRSLMMLTEVLGFDCPSYEFGSYHNNLPCEDDDSYLLNVAYSILSKFKEDSAVQTKIYCRLRYNFEAIYTQYYQAMINY